MKIRPRARASSPREFVYRTEMAPAPTLTAEEKKAAVDSVLQTASFLRAGQLRSFLRFICDMEISGRAAEITEYLIGVEALGRPAGYSTAEDSIVRRRAIDLREKLEDVYVGDLAGAKIRIDLPKGRYVPHFVLAESVADRPAPSVETGPAAAPARAMSAARAFLLGLGLGSLLTSAVFLLVQRGVAPAPPPRPPDPPGVTYEGESRANTVHGTTNVGDCPPCSGGSRVRNIGNSASNYVTINGITVAADGNYTLLIDYVLLGQRSFIVSVNDAAPIELALRGESWAVPSRAAITVPLKAGLNSVRFFNDHAYAPDLDRVVIR
jgi:hypothetical protein